MTTLGLRTGVQSLSDGFWGLLALTPRRQGGDSIPRLAGAA